MDEVINLERSKQMTTRNCNECGEAISEARLKARPSAQLCIKCQEQQEQDAKANYVSPTAYFHPRAINTVMKHAKAYSLGVNMHEVYTDVPLAISPSTEVAYDTKQE
jgi:uncharacterized paraquat-inducible protein A